MKDNENINFITPISAGSSKREIRRGQKKHSLINLIYEKNIVDTNTISVFNVCKQ